MKNVFKPADILIPQNVDMTAWSVVACDQFTSEPEYWREVEKIVGDKPSTLRLMLPEAYLEETDSDSTTKRINAEMQKYLSEGLFKEYKNSYIYVERTLNSGAVRSGLVGVLDLECYDYSENSSSPIRATEGTVPNRLPPRVKVRRDAPIEMPHIMVLIDDPEDTVMQAAKGGKTVYDFALMQGGGHIKGSLAPDIAAVDAAVDSLSDPQILSKKYGGAVKSPVIFAMGDGNHSLATAQKCWDELKPTLTEQQRKTHPARFALVELVNIHDDAIGFEPIHKVIFNTDNAGFIDAAKKFFAGRQGEGHEITLIAGAKTQPLKLCGYTIGELIGVCEEFCQDYIKKHGGKIDYIHGDDEARGMAGGAACAGILLPRMSKGELFPSVMQSGPFPKKSFSIGLAPDKRYYLECRKLK